MKEIVPRFPMAKKHNLNYGAYNHTAKPVFKP